MRDRKQTMSVLAAALAGLAFLAAGAADLTVQVREAQLRAAPSFLGKLTGTCAYGDRVTVLEERGDWKKVKASAGPSGWLHGSALTARRVVLQAGEPTAQTGASSDELALAGKGFNSDVEAEFKRRNRAVDFTWVDRMEKIRVAPGQMQAFLKAGGVQPAAGGAQ